MFTYKREMYCSEAGFAGRGATRAGYVFRVSDPHLCGLGIRRQDEPVYLTALPGTFDVGQLYTVETIVSPVDPKDQP